MPKDGLSHSQWLLRLKSFAAGEFNFQRGQRPPQNSEWAVKFAAVAKCPLQKNREGLDLFRNPLKCECGYHTGPSPPKKSRFQYASYVS